MWSIMKQAAASSRTTRKRELTRHILVAAAEQLVASHGLDAISIDEITEAADVAKGTFYTHFTGKDDLALAIGNRTRFELEDMVAHRNQGIHDAAERLANGLSIAFVFAISNPLRARALLRLQPRFVDPDESINAGVRSDIALGLSSKRFWARSLSAAVVTTLGAAMSAIMRLTDRNRRVSQPFEFSADIIATVLVALGLKPASAGRLATTAIEFHKKESKHDQSR